MDTFIHCVFLLLHRQTNVKAVVQKARHVGKHLHVVSEVGHCIGGKVLLCLEIRVKEAVDVVFGDEEENVVAETKR